MEKVLATKNTVKKVINHQYRSDELLANYVHPSSIIIINSESCQSLIMLIAVRAGVLAPEFDTGCSRKIVLFPEKVQYSCLVGNGCLKVGR